MLKWLKRQFVTAEVPALPDDPGSFPAWSELWAKRIEDAEVVIAAGETSTYLTQEGILDIGKRLTELEGQHAIMLEALTRIEKKTPKKRKAAKA